MSHARGVCSLLLALVLAAAAGPAEAATIVTLGALPSSRDGYSPLRAGSDLRSALSSTANFGAAGAADPDIAFAYQFVGTASAFGSADLAGVDILVLDFHPSYSGYTLSTAEATAIRDFVLAGHSLIVYADWDGGTPAAALLSQFGGLTTTNDWDPDSAWTFQPGVAEVTSGPFGTLSGSFNVGNNAISSVSALGTNALAVTKNGAKVGAALIKRGALGTGAGAVFVYNDFAYNLFVGYGGAAAQNLSLNAFDSFANDLATPVPEPAALLAAGLALALAARRRQG